MKRKRNYFDEWWWLNRICEVVVTVFAVVMAVAALYVFAIGACVLAGRF